MKFAIGWLLAWMTGLVYADSVSTQAVQPFLDSFYAALRQHQAGRLTTMISPRASIIVYLHDDDGEKKFTLSRDDYLQQITSTWHFARNETWDIQHVQIRALPGGKIEVSLDESESRVILDRPTGQQNQLTLQLETADNGLRIACLTSHTSLW